MAREELPYSALQKSFGTRNGARRSVGTQPAGMTGGYARSRPRTTNVNEITRRRGQ
jgi:hypothetical protein